MSDTVTAQRYVVRYPNVEALQFDGTDECARQLQQWGAPVCPDPLPDGGWMLECTAIGAYRPQSLYRNVWVIHSELGWDICEPEQFERMYTKVG
ncbi:hypothetical protein [Nocardia terpenica]|uniref:hypothetical protein n=1 Tax=Nocardia terpenica TaxID=455432 RepID=UPI0012FD1E1E|nr:hypothetical protein [Nocardia terpenica]